MDSVLALHPATLGLILGVPKNLFLAEIILSTLLRFMDSTALLSIKWTVQRLYNVDRTHQALQDSATKKHF